MLVSKTWVKIVFRGREQLISHQEMRTALDVMLFVSQRAEAVTYFECNEWIARGT